MTVEEIMRFGKTVKPFIQRKMVEINFEGKGEQDSEDFGKDFDEIIALAVDCFVLRERLEENKKAWKVTRGEIDEEKEYAYADFEEYKKDMLEVEDEDDAPQDYFWYGLQRALEIIGVNEPKIGDEKK